MSVFDRPCVYVLHPVSRHPTFVTICENSRMAVQMALSLSRIFHASAWVAGWDDY